MQNAEPVLEASRPNRAACALDLEGIVAKRFDDVYEPLIDGHNPGMRPCEIADVEPRDVAGFRRVFRWWRRPPQNLPAIISRTQSAPARRPRSRPARSIVYNCALIDFARHHAFQPKGLSPIPGQNQGEGRAPVSVYPRGFLPRPLVPESGRPSRPVPAAGLVLPLRDTLPKLLSSANTTVDCGNALRHTKLQFQRATVKLLGRRVSRRDQPAMA